MRPLCLAVLALAAALLPAANAWAAPPLRPLGPPTVVAVASDGDRLLAYQRRNDSRELTVIDTETDRRRRVALPSGCGRLPTATAPHEIGERGVILRCGSGDALLDLRTGEHRALPAGHTFFDVGRHWVSGDADRSCGGHSCDIFLNLDTGEQRFRPDSAAPIDLDAADFRRLEVCRPFTADDLTGVLGLGAYDPPFLLVADDGGYVLRRCGRTRAIRLEPPRPNALYPMVRPMVRAGFAVWSTSTHLRAYDARARRRFAWRISGARRNGAEALQTRHRAVTAVVASLDYGEVIELPATYRLYWARIPR